MFCKLEIRVEASFKDGSLGNNHAGEFESRSGGHCEDLDYSIIIKFQFVARLIALGLLQGE